MDELAIKQKAAGILTDDIAPIKLNIVAKPAPAPAPAMAVDGKGKAGGEGKVFVEEEEEETKKKRVLVKLDYGDGLTVEERELKRVQGLAKIKLEKVPKTADALFNVPVKWDAINEVIIEKKLLPLVRRKLFDSLGEMDDDDLLKFVISHIRERKSAADLVEGLEPVSTLSLSVLPLSYPARPARPRHCILPPSVVPSICQAIWSKVHAE